VKTVLLYSFAAVGALVVFNVGLVFVVACAREVERQRRGRARRIIEQRHRDEAMRATGLL
jgi:hypothetical protein